MQTKTKGVAGRDPADPQNLMAVRLHAALKGVGSARELARLYERHLAYRWFSRHEPCPFAAASPGRSSGGS